MRTLSARPALALTLAALTLGGAVGTASAAAGDPSGPIIAPSPVPAATPAADGVDTSPVWIVSGAQEFASRLGTAATRVATAEDSAGSPVVLSTTTSDRLGRLSAPAGEQRRGPGFRAFATKAEAEAFVAHDLTAQTVEQALAAYSVDNQATVTPWLAQVDHNRIKATITHLSTAYPNRYYSTTYGRQAGIWIKDTWAALAAGRSDVTASLFDGCTNCSTQPSVLLTVTGSEKPDEIVVLGGHFDSTSKTGTGNAMRAPGADDNASGIATITEVARVALANGWKPKRTVVFAAYAAEEVGLRGSAAVAKSFKSQGKNVVGVMQLDMTNYRPATGPDMAFMTDNVNGPLTAFGKQLFDTYLKPAGLTRSEMTCGYACSDHASWTSQGYPSMMAAEPKLFPQLHTTGDTLANMGNTAQPSEKFAKLGLAFVGEVAKTAAVNPAPVPPTPTPPAPSPTEPVPGPGPAPAPEQDVLTNGVPRTGLSGASKSMTTYRVQVPAGARNLTVSTSGGQGDVDLYTRAGSAPTTFSWTCRPFAFGNAETCTVAAPPAGTYYVGLHGYAAYSGVTLTASWDG